jgi:hypothetical protein
VNGTRKELEAVGARLDILFARQEEIVVRLEDIGREVVALREKSAAIEALERRLAATQAMASRAYEQAQDWPGRLAEIRARPDYEAPYGPEPLVSVTIPTYNRADLLCGRALPSLLRQTYENWEAVIVGDGCTDDTEERIRALGDERLRFENRPFRGPYPEDESERLLVYGAPASLRAIELARGLWLTQLDDDDEWDHDTIEVLLAEAQRTHAEIAYAKWRQRDARNGRLVAREFGEWPLRFERFAFQAAIWHHAIGELGPDMNMRFSGEAGDWARARRLWEAGARFTFLDRAVTTIWFMPRSEEAAQRFGWLTDTFGYADDSV